MKTRLLIIAAIFLILLAAAVSLYLLNIHLYAGGSDVCSTVFGSSCEGSLTSSWSEVLGLPLGGWGVLYYLSIGLLFLVPLLFGREFNRTSRFFIFILSVCGILAGIFFIVLMASQPSLFCPFCTVIHVSNFFLFFLFLKINRYGFREFLSDIKSVLNPMFFKSFSASSFWKTFGLLIIGFFVLSGFFGLRILTLKAAAAQKVDFNKVFADYDNEPVKQISMNTGDAVVGDTTSKMVLTIFSDFYCPACRLFSAETDSIIKKFNKDCAIVFKQFPLNTDCNHTISKNIHPGACDAAKASLAASQQGKFVFFHTEVFKQGSKANLIDIAKKTGLDLQAFENFRNSPAADAIVQKNIQEANLLGVNGTPAVFLNGRQIKDIRKGVIQMVLMRELSKRQLAYVDRNNKVAYAFSLTSFPSL